MSGWSWAPAGPRGGAGCVSVGGSDLWWGPPSSRRKGQCGVSWVQQVGWAKDIPHSGAYPSDRGETQGGEMGHVRQQGQVFAPLGAPRMASVLQGTGGEDRVPAWAPCSPVGPAAEAASCLVTTLKKKRKMRKKWVKLIVTVCFIQPNIPVRLDYKAC